jgi:hypothetical protein
VRTFDKTGASHHAEPLQIALAESVFLQFALLPLTKRVIAKAFCLLSQCRLDLD